MKFKKKDAKLNVFEITRGIEALYSTLEFGKGTKVY